MFPFPKALNKKKNEVLHESRKREKFLDTKQITEMEKSVEAQNIE